MAAAIPIRIQHGEQGIRPLDTLRDLPTVVNLVEQGFGPELDPPGQRMLIRMRRAAQRNWWARFWGLETLDLPGFVWVEDGTVIANLSIRRTPTGPRGGWVIGNVVVHPAHRQRGIGRALMETALNTVEERGGRWIGLEVRADNAAAHTLYTRLGFKTVGETAHLLRPAGLPWPATTPVTRDWRPHRDGDENRWYALARQVYPHPQNELLEVRRSEYTYGGWERTLQLWLEGRHERAWLHTAPEPRLALCAQTDRRFRFHIWELLAHPSADATEVSALTTQALYAMRKQAAWPTTSIVAPQPLLLTALTQVGFQVHRMLMQMKMTL